jgi:hypothetical protein
MDPARREGYWAAAATVIAEAERSGVKLVPSLGYGCPDTGAPCNPARGAFMPLNAADLPTLMRKAFSIWGDDLPR